MPPTLKCSKCGGKHWTMRCPLKAPDQRAKTLEEIKAGKLDNHKQVLAIITDEKNYDLLRKGKYGITKTQVKRAEKNGEKLTPILDVLIKKYRKIPDWTRTEKVLNYVDLTAGVRNELVFPDAFVDKIRSKNVESVFDVAPGSKGVGWFCLSEVITKVTKNGKPFYRFKIIDMENNTGWLRVWGSLKKEPELYTLWMAEVSNDPNWGMSTSAAKIRKLTVFDK